jgi:hypothetical protein
LGIVVIASAILAGMGTKKEAKGWEDCPGTALEPGWKETAQALMPGTGMLSVRAMAPGCTGLTQT